MATETIPRNLQVGIEDLVGLHHLDGRGELVDKATDRYTEDAAVVVLRLDGTLYWSASRFA